MKVKHTKLPGVFAIEPDIFSDDRGALIRSFNKDIFVKHGLISSLEQSLCTISNKGVIRGMHFQTPPKEQKKILYVSHGSITDVILDIRKGSPTYGQFVTIELSDKNNHMAYIPTGCAHGFLAHEDCTRVVYLQDTMQAPENEATINVNSFGMDWGVANTIISKKDSTAPSLENYDSPFLYSEKKYENID